MLKRHVGSLSEDFSTHVPERVRAHGHRIFQAGRVEFLSGDQHDLELVVCGPGRYEVTLDRTPVEVGFACTCPDHRRSLEVCEHVWAGILWAEKDGWLWSDADPAEVDLVPIGVDEEDEPLGGAFLGDEDFVIHGERAADGYRRCDTTRERPAPPSKPPWVEFLEAARAGADGAPKYRDRIQALRSKTELIYVVDPKRSIAEGNFQFEVLHRKQKKDGSWNRARPFSLLRTRVEELPSTPDRRIANLLAQIYLGGDRRFYYFAGAYNHHVFSLSGEALDVAIPLLAATDRLFVRSKDGRSGFSKLELDDRAPWEFRLRVDADHDTEKWSLSGFLRRSDKTMDLSKPALLLADGWVFTRKQVARLQNTEPFTWIDLLRRQGSIDVPFGDEDRLLELVHEIPGVPPVDWPPSLEIESIAVEPQPRLRVLEPRHDPRANPRLRVELGFLYDRTFVRARDERSLVYQREGRKILSRDPRAEEDALRTLLELQCLPLPDYMEYSEEDVLPPELEIAPGKLPRLVRELVRRHWHVEAEGKVYRRAGTFRIDVKSGVDWFDLDGHVEFDGQAVLLPRVLKALQRGQNTVLLGDGTHGILPEEWLKKYGILLETGKVHGGAVRFRHSQVALIDALVEETEHTWDEAFERLRENLRAFDGIHPVDAPPEFRGALRAYQAEGLGWMEFLRRFGFGGCLADDMGLGKTVQVLALLEARRAERAGGKAQSKPSLVVAPRSVIFNWRSEAARFTPHLRVLDHTGSQRVKERTHLEEFDLVLTTYGTLRQDVLFLREVPFDYVVLDESQAIKNATSRAATAARALQGDYRLALSGTPVENHLGELWSLFEFLNPGMLGRASVFRKLAAGRPDSDGGSSQLLARACRPFILRRTKQQVVRDLPDKVEQTILCELTKTERRIYDELRDYYRTNLRQRVETVGLGRVKIQVLEALLRLRQAACHPGLLDEERREDSSSKIELLLERLTEIDQEGNKVLVFSQFTSFLSILRRKLDALGIAYEYLDGRTRKREEKVRRFQEDEDCHLFLISLKAGGLGLNLTAAEYVFLLDPWWNPAVESQAIDRAHRIGQTRRVFACRIIARDTVEERVLELQAKKRRLVESLIGGTGNVIRDLTREDLELLLS